MLIILKIIHIFQSFRSRFKGKSSGNMLTDQDFFRIFCWIIVKFEKFSKRVEI